MIAAVDLSAGYDRCDVLRHVDLTLAPGELVAFVGPNGAGKSTLLRTLAGLLPPLAGMVRIDGDDVQSLGARDRARRVAYVAADDATVDDLRLDEIVMQGRVAHIAWWRFGTTPADDAAVERAIVLAGLEKQRARRIGSLSSGEAQRVWIGMALAQDAPILLLDEPTSHLDVRAAHETLALLVRLARAGHAIGVVLHDLNLAARYADRIALVAGGGIAALGTPHDVIRADRLSTAYDAEIRVLQDDDGTPVAVSRAAREG